MIKSAPKILKQPPSNYCFIDWQNLYRWLNWQLEYKKFRIYLEDKYKVKKAYYFLWFKEKENALYEKLQEAWFFLVFNEKPEHLRSNKKWNIDVNLVFHAMKKLYEAEINKEKYFDKIVLISWDWDFKVMVDYFLERWKFLKILFPNKKYASSLYNKLFNKNFSYIDSFKHKIEYKKKKKVP